MNDLKLRQQLSDWHRDRFDADVAPERLRDAVLAMPETESVLRGRAPERTRLGRPMILLVAAALLVSAVGGALALGSRATPRDFSTMNVCDVLGSESNGTFAPAEYGYSEMVTSRELAATRRGEALRTVAPGGSCRYTDPSGIVFVEFRSQETTREEAAEIVSDGRYATGFNERPSIQGAAVWQVCALSAVPGRNETSGGRNCGHALVSAEPYFFGISMYDPAVIARVLDVLSGTR
jgi:hypothetical protein